MTAAITLATVIRKAMAMVTATIVSDRPQSCAESKDKLLALANLSHLTV
jgi:hypothetical protein